MNNRPKAKGAQDRAQTQMAACPGQKRHQYDDDNHKHTGAVGDNPVHKVGRLESVRHAKGQIIVGRHPQVSRLVHGKAKCDANQRSRHVNEAVEETVAFGASYGSVKDERPEFK